MFRSSREMPKNGAHFAADFFIDDGVPGNGRRSGICDDEFREIGVSFATRSLGEYVVLLHFADEFGRNAIS